MRILMFAAIAALAACAMGGGGPANDAPSPTRSPFPVHRGTAPPPPTSSGASQAIPPEGRAAGGLDFGQWRLGEASAYAAAFQSQISAREQGRDAPQVRSDLESNGFACEDATRLDCRIEIREQQCAYTWYVVVEAGRDTPAAGFEKSCGQSR